MNWAPACVRSQSRTSPISGTRAIAGEGQTNCPFSYSGPLTESVLLGTVAAHFPDKTLEWDTAAMKVTNESAANQYVGREYRKQYAAADLL